MTADLPYEHRLINYQAAQIKALTLQCHLLRLELHLSNAERWLWPNVKALEDEVRDLRAERARVAVELRSQIDRMRNSGYTETVTARACGDLDALACMLEVTP